jgi:NAD(P)-dependent dehydrogenase (short-subunit alcohol dehydrogenase family)/general stress protein 26
VDKYAGKKAVITGGTHGMGLATAVALLAGGAEVLVTGHNEQHLAAAREKLGPNARVLRSDTTSLTDIDALAKVVADEFGPVDFVHINAGFAEIEPIEQVTEASYDKTFAVNTRGAFFTVQRLLPHVADGGALVFTTAVADGTGTPGMATFSGAKAALRAFAQVLAAELLPRSIRVNVVSPASSGHRPWASPARPRSTGSCSPRKAPRSHRFAGSGPRRRSRPRRCSSASTRPSPPASSWRSTAVSHRGWFPSGRSDAMVDKVAKFDDIQDSFFDYVQDIVYATMITVDKLGRPRARVLLPIWQVVDGEPIGWLAAYRTPVKTAHLANNPHATFSYWSDRQNVVHVDTVSTWVDDTDVKHKAWELYRKGSPPGVGYDPIRYWRKGMDDPEFAVLRMVPWRVQVVRGTDLFSRIWESDGTPPAQLATARTAEKPAAAAGPSSLEHDVVTTGKDK